VTKPFRTHGHAVAAVPALVILSLLAFVLPAPEASAQFSTFNCAEWQAYHYEFKVFGIRSQPGLDTEWDERMDVVEAWLDANDESSIFDSTYTAPEWDPDDPTLDDNGECIVRIGGYATGPTSLLSNGAPTLTGLVAGESLALSGLSLQVNESGTGGWFGATAESLIARLAEPSQANKSVTLVQGAAPLAPYGTSSIGLAQGFVGGRSLDPYNGYDTTVTMQFTSLPGNDGTAKVSARIRNRLGLERSVQSTGVLAPCTALSCSSVQVSAEGISTPPLEPPYSTYSGGIAIGRVHGDGRTFQPTSNPSRDPVHLGHPPWARGVEPGDTWELYSDPDCTPGSEWVCGMPLAGGMPVDAALDQAGAWMTTEVYVTCNLYSGGVVELVQRSVWSGANAPATAPVPQCSPSYGAPSLGEPGRIEIARTVYGHPRQTLAVWERPPLNESPGLECRLDRSCVDMEVATTPSGRREYRDPDGNVVSRQAVEARIRVSPVADPTPYLDPTGNPIPSPITGEPPPDPGTTTTVPATTSPPTTSVENCTAGPLCNPAPNTDSDGCLSSEWSWNPVSWVLAPIKCAFLWAFVPPGGWGSAIATQRNQVADSPQWTELGETVSLITTVFSGGCETYEISWSSVGAEIGTLDLWGCENEWIRAAWYLMSFFAVVGLAKQTVDSIATHRQEVARAG